MATDARGHTVPAGSDAFDPQGSDVAVSLSINDTLYAANATARTSLVAAIAPTTSRPALVLQTDTGVLWKHDGTNALPIGPYLPVAGTWGLASDQAITTGAFTVLAAGTAVGTPDSSLTNSSGAITIANAGVYQATVQARWVGAGSTAVTRRSFSFTLNCASINGSGALVAGTLVGANVVTSGTVDITQNAATPRFTAAAGDVLRVFALHDAGVTATIAKGANDYLGVTLLTVTRVG